MKKWQNYSLEQLREAVASSKTIAEILDKLGVPSPGGYKAVNKYINEYSIDISHFGRKNTEGYIKPNRKIDKETFLKTVANSYSNSQVIRSLGWGSPESGTNRRWLRKFYEWYDSDKSHFTGQGWNKGKIYPEKRKPIDEYLIQGKKTNSHNLRLKLLEQGLFLKECSLCKHSKWQGEPIKLTLDHINGDRTDNTLQNLRILCGNCHAQTPTYKGKNQKRAIKKPSEALSGNKPEKIVRPKKVRFCIDCSTSISNKAERCKSCVGKIKASKSPGPLFKYSVEWLKEQLKTMPYTTLAAQLKCSDNAIRKKIERYEEQQKKT